MKKGIHRATCIIGYVMAVAIIMLATGAAAQAPQDTLSVVNWNLEFFGDNGSELPEEMVKTRTIMNNLDADIYALVEVVNKDSLQSLVNSLNDDYGYILSPFGSSASGITDPAWFDAQKLAFVYRKSVVRNVSGRALMQYSPTAYYNWSSGRFPYLVNAEVLGKDNIWQPLKFIIVHAKAMSDNNSCTRRHDGAIELKDSLDQYFPDDKLIILGDFNDDLDISICSGSQESNYSNFVMDSIDANSYKCLTLPLSKTGISTIAGYSSFLDHVIISNEMTELYVPGSAQMLKNQVNSWVTSYTSYVSDHYPVQTKYVLTGATVVSGHVTKKNGLIFPNPAKSVITVESSLVDGFEYKILTMDGRIVVSGNAATNRCSVDISLLPPGSYFLKLTSKNRSYQEAQIIIKQ